MSEHWKGICDKLILVLILYFYLKTFAQTKHALLIPQISIGGYSQKLSFGLTTQFGNKVPIRIGSRHLESIFEEKESNSLSVYLQIGMKF